MDMADEKIEKGSGAEPAAEGQERAARRRRPRRRAKGAAGQPEASETQGPAVRPQASGAKRNASGGARPGAAAPQDAAAEAPRKPRNGRARPPKGGDGPAPERSGVRCGHARRIEMILLALVAVLAVSLSIGQWLRQREARAVMRSVYEELKSNREALERCARALDSDRRAVGLLRECGPEWRKVPVDSLERYRSVWVPTPGFVPQRGALELLCWSGTVRSVGDRELLLDVLDGYARMERFASALGSYDGRKRDSGCGRLFAGSVSGEAPERWGSAMADPACAALLASMEASLESGLDGRGLLREIDAAVGALNERYGFE